MDVDLKKYILKFGQRYMTVDELQAVWGVPMDHYDGIEKVN